MKRYKKLFSFVTLSLMFLGLSVVVSAGKLNRSESFPENGGNDQILRLAIKNLKKNSRIFERVLKSELTGGGIFGTHLEKMAGGLKNAIIVLDKNFKGDLKKSSAETRRVLGYGEKLKRTLSGSRIFRDSYVLQKYWRNIDKDLRTILRAYNRTSSGSKPVHTLSRNKKLSEVNRVSDFWSCAKPFEPAFARESARILFDQATALQELNPERRRRRLEEIEIRKHQIKINLIANLNKCLDMTGPPKARFILVPDDLPKGSHLEPFSVPLYHQLLVEKYLEPKS